MASEQHDQKRWTVLALLQWTRQFLGKKGVESPRLEAEVLLAHVLGWDRVKLYTQFDHVVPADKLAAFKELIVQRAAHRPTQYILGRCEFMSLEFRVTPAVLIPRPETELLVEALVARARTMAAARVLDLGTGSGCIAIAAAKALPAAEVWAVDSSADAIRVAEENARLHGLIGQDGPQRLRLLQGDLFEPVRGLAFDFVASNPPYVSEAEWQTLTPEVRDYEPKAALLGGPDGLDVYRRILPESVNFLAPGGRVLLELPAGKSEGVRRLAPPPLVAEETLRDYQGIERVLVLRREER